MKPEFEKIQNRPLHSFMARVVSRSKRPTLKEAWHYHPEIEICFTLKSEGKRFVGNNISDYRSGDLVMFGSNLPHGFITDYRSEQIVIQFQDGFLGPEFLEKPETQTLRDLLLKSKRGIQFYGETQRQARPKLYRILKSEGFAKIMHLLDLLHHLASSTENEYITQESFEANTKLTELERVQVIYDYILKNYREGVSLDHAAQLISMTKSSFCKYLKKHTKKTFSQIVNEIRISHACELMIQTDKKISTVAFESGFNDVSYFSRAFKKVIATSPRDFMQKYRQPPATGFEKPLAIHTAKP
ncbi:MAG: AraC family transcriptional regulator [Saprospiraceae bacterium]|nr:AraC family transcriptional regulator [Saprospiraceae bacterium]